MVVAVVDSGVNYNHKALNANIFTNINEIPDNNIDDDQNGFVDDVVGYDFAFGDSQPLMIKAMELMLPDLLLHRPQELQVMQKFSH